MTLIVFILILSVLVLVHEFGHFIVAKKLGIRVEEFGLGIPPRLIGKKIGETTYSLNLLPFGGFVKVTGEDFEDVEAGTNPTNDPRSFSSRLPWQRIAVLVAGVFMNMVLAVILFYTVLGLNSFRTQYIPMFFDYHFKFGQEKSLGTVVAALQDKSPASKAGIKSGEAILDIDGIPVTSVSDVHDVLKNKMGQNVSVLLMDVRTDFNGSTRTVTLQPDVDAKGNVILGVFLTKATSVSYAGPVERYFTGFLHSYNVLDYSVSSFAHLITFSVKEKTISPVSQSVAGPVGIYELIGGLLEYGGPKVLFSILDFLGLMSVSLAFVNILPFPALDGGRVLFVVIEKLRGKRFAASVETTFHKFGFLFLLGLLVLITIKDILH